MFRWMVLFKTRLGTNNLWLLRLSNKLLLWNLLLATLLEDLRSNHRLFNLSRRLLVLTNMNMDNVLVFFRTLQSENIS